MLTVTIPDDDSRTATTEYAPINENCELSPLSCFVAITGLSSSESTITNTENTFEDCKLEIPDDGPPTATTDDAPISENGELSPLSNFVETSEHPSSELNIANPTNTLKDINTLSEESHAEIDIDYNYINLINTLQKAFVNDRCDYTSTLMQHIQMISCENAKKVYIKLYLLIDDNFDKRKTLVNDDGDYMFMNTLTPDKIKKFINRYINIGTFFEYLAEACGIPPVDRVQIWSERENTRISERASFQETSTKAVQDLILQNKYRNNMKLIYNLYRFTKKNHIDNIEIIIRSKSKNLLKKPPGFWNTISFKNHTYYRLSSLVYKILKLSKKHGRSLIPRPTHERCIEIVKEMANKPINKRRILYDFWHGNLK